MLLKEFYSKNAMFLYMIGLCMLDKLFSVRQKIKRRLTGSFDLLE
jgi:hypothetical protein